MDIAMALDLVFVIIALVMVINGAKRGFIHSIIHSAKWLLGLIIAYFFGGHLGGLIHATLLEKSIYHFVHQKVESIYLENTAAFNTESVMETVPRFLLGEELQGRLDALEGSGEELVASLSREIALPISNFLANVLGYIGVFLIAVFGLWLISKLITGIVDKITVLSMVNRFLGAAWALLVAVPILLSLASVIKLFAGSSPAYLDSVIVKAFGESSILELWEIFNVGAIWLTNLFR